MLLAALALLAQTAPVPLYRDPVHDGAADPSIVHDKARWHRRSVLQVAALREQDGTITVDRGPTHVQLDD